MAYRARSLALHRIDWHYRPLTSIAPPLPMIDCVPSGELRGEAQLVVTELVEPEPELDRVPEPVQSVLLERCSDSLMDCPMPELSWVP